MYSNDWKRIWNTFQKQIQKKNIAGIAACILHKEVNLMHYKILYKKNAERANVRILYDSYARKDFLHYI